MTTSTASLLTPLRLGSIELRNRIVMAPLTRMRAGPGHIPTALNGEYYGQRASAGLIISEGTAISAQAQGYPAAPGIYTAEQVAAWRRVTDAVHFRGGRMVMQIAHNGRNSHSSFMPDGGPPVAPSAIPPNLPGFTDDFRQVPIETPRALGTEEVNAIVKDFRSASINAMEAGFDGVEIQGANSHLVDQFLEDGSNLRTDEYGGSIENRSRFLLEIVDDVAAAIGPNCLGVRLSPFGHYGGIQDSQALELFTYAIRSLGQRRIAYLHLIEGRGSEIGLADELHTDARNNAELFHSMFQGPLISAAAYTPASGAETIEKGHADAIAFGRSFIANPDLVERIAGGYPLTPYDRSTFYGGGARGYTDYDTWHAGQAVAAL
ncbi:MAG: alkene reductase [Bryobacteraceae bacterium]|jgi:N-ethylmaleimide reductase